MLLRVALQSHNPYIEGVVVALGPTILSVSVVPVVPVVPVTVTVTVCRRAPHPHCVHPWGSASLLSSVCSRRCCRGP